MVEIRQLPPRQLVQLEWQSFQPNFFAGGLFMGELLFPQLSKLLHDAAKVDAAGQARSAVAGAW